MLPGQKIRRDLRLQQAYRDGEITMPKSEIGWKSMTGEPNLPALGDFAKPREKKNLAERLRIASDRAFPTPAICREAATEIERLTNALALAEDQWRVTDAENAGHISDKRRLAEHLKKAREMVAFWADYASEYFREKHGLADELATLDAAINSQGFLPDGDTLTPFGESLRDFVEECARDRDDRVSPAMKRKAMDILGLP